MIGDDATRIKGEHLRVQLGEGTSILEDNIPGYDRYVDEAIYGGFWARSGLDMGNRMICTLTTLGALRCDKPLRRMVAGALNISVPPNSILEVFLQLGLYAGFSSAEMAIELACEVFKGKGVRINKDDDYWSAEGRILSDGEELMSKLHKERAQEGYASRDNPHTAELYNLAVKYGYGAVWSRPGLDLKSRMVCALAAFTVLNLDSQLTKFSLSAGNVGLSQTEIIEVIMHTAPYGGFPRALNAVSLVSKLF